MRGRYVETFKTVIGQPMVKLRLIFWCRNKIRSGLDGLELTYRWMVLDAKSVPRYGRSCDSLSMILPQLEKPELKWYNQ